MHQARKLFVEDTTGPIYEAHWVSRISSMSFPGPIYEPLSPNPYFSITKGYPRRRDPTVEDEDPRFAPRIKAGLEKAGKLCAIDLNAECVEPTIQMTGQPWSEVGEDMLVRVGYFENGFRLGEMARAHIFFAGGEKTRKQFDSLTFKITFVANERTFRSNTTIEGVPVAEIEDGIYVCTFSPWEPVEDFDRKAEPGTGVITLTVLLQRQGKTVYRLDFPESRVPVRRATKTAQQDRPESE